MAFSGLGILVLILRWAFARGGSVVERAAKSGNPDEYGMMVPIASPSNYIEGEVLRRFLVDAGLRASLAQTNEGPRIMVWPKDVETAKQVLKKAGGLPHE